MLQTVRDACDFDATAVSYVLADQVEDLTDIVKRSPAAAEAFFNKTYVTGGMGDLLRYGLQRLSGTSSQAVFELKQAMGGGKTHCMLALGYLAAYPELKALVPAEITHDIPLAESRVVAISGRSISHNKHLWGDIAEQLGEPDAFLRFYKGAPSAPNEPDWISLIGQKPTLILLDELPPYFAHAVTQTVGSGTLATIATAALGNLLSAARKIPHLCIVISNLAGSYHEAAKELTALVQRDITNAQNEALRQARPITPVDIATNDIFSILRKRLLSADPSSSVISSCANAYADAISDAIKSKTIAPSATALADEIVASYPFHPSFKHIVALFKDNQRFRQTRDVMTLAATMVKSVQERVTNDVYLIGCQHLDLSKAEVRDAITNIYDLGPAIAQDIAGTGAGRAHAKVIDEQMKSDAATQVAALVLLSSLPEENRAIKGLSKEQIIEDLIAPNRTPSEFQDAFDKLRAECWYLHSRDNGAWYFARNENIKKKIQKYAQTAPSPRINDELERRLLNVFKPTRHLAYSEVKALPKISDIKLNGKRTLLVLSPDRKIPPAEAQQLFLDTPNKNNFCVVTGTGSDLAKLEDKVRRIWAIEKVRVEDGGDSSPNRAEIETEAENADFDFNACLISLFNRLYYPAKHPTTGDELLYVALKLVQTKVDGNKAGIDGEKAVEDALSDTSASKLERELNDTNVDALRSRAEDLLWPENTRRVRWRDLEERATCNVRWKWLPPKGLDDLRNRAIAKGDWRDAKDGFIEKGPFPPPQTSVKAITKDRDDSGEATIELTASGAGPKALIYSSSSPNVLNGKALVEDSVIKRSDTVLYFWAVDPDGQHETGSAEEWRNTLSITHGQTEIMGKRSVTLDVRPRGVIRWNLQGTNPRDGEIYQEPISIPGDAETTVYAYAEDAGVTVEHSFRIPARDGDGGIDPIKPAAVVKKIKLTSTPDVFAVLRAADIAKVLFGNAIAVTVGKGDINVMSRFGPGTTLTPASLEHFIMASRVALGDQNADVEVGFGSMRFNTGRELEEFCKDAVDQIKLVANEVQQ